MVLAIAKSNRYIAARKIVVYLQLFAYIKRTRSSFFVDCDCFCPIVIVLLVFNITKISKISLKIITPETTLLWQINYNGSSSKFSGFGYCMECAFGIG